jgi:hypothetical protein
MDTQLERMERLLEEARKDSLHFGVAVDDLVQFLSARNTEYRQRAEAAELLVAELVTGIITRARARA